MFEWFWNLPIMQTLQSWVDMTRALPIDPIHMMIGVVAAGLAAIWWMSRPASVRDHKPPGGHYTGKITPKSLPGMLQTPQPKRLKTRKDKEEALKRARTARKRAIERDGG